MSDLKRIFLCTCLAGAIGTSAFGQATQYWVELDGPAGAPVGLNTDQSSFITVGLGGSVHLGIYIDDIPQGAADGCEFCVRGSQMEIPVTTVPAGPTIPFAGAVNSSNTQVDGLTNIGGGCNFPDCFALAPVDNGVSIRIANSYSAAASVPVTGPTYIGGVRVDVGAAPVGTYDVDMIQASSFVTDEASAIFPMTFNTLTINVAPLPAPNDDCANRILITDGVTAGFTNDVGTTDGPPENCVPNGVAQVNFDVWYNYVSTCTGFLTASTCEELGGGANFDTKVAVYDGTGCSPLGVLLSCNDDDQINPCGGGGGGFHSTANVPVVSGNAYKIRVGGFGAGDFGDFDLLVDCSECLLDSDCDNNDVCDGLETCVAGTCTPGTPLVADDGVACTDDACDPITGVSNTPNDANCDDNDICNGLETCDAVLDCQPGTPLDCDDAVGCTDDACDSISGCSNTPNDGNCQNGQFCDGAEICDAIADCVDGADPDCDGAFVTNACAVAACDEVGDACVGGQLSNLTCGGDADCQLFAANGTCGGGGICEFTCATDDDCNGNNGLAANGTCGVGGLCECALVLNPDMCLEAQIDNTLVPNDECYDNGATIFVEVTMTGPIPPPGVTGAQFFIQYDTSALTLLDAHPGGTHAEATFPNGTFVFQLFEDQNPADCTGGCLDYAVGNNPLGAKTPSVGPATVAILEFAAVADSCESDANAVCYRVPHNPPNGFGQGDGALIVPDGILNGTPCCTGAININGDAPEWACPNLGDSVNADCGGTTKTLSYPPIVASDDCGDPTQSCTVAFHPSCEVDGDCGAGGTCDVDDFCTNAAPGDFSGYLDCTDGCVFEVGRYVFDCDATSKCGLSSDCDFEVVNTGMNELVVDIEVSPTMHPGNVFNPLTRCFDLRLLACGALGEPLEHNVQVDVVLGLGGNFPGQTRGHGRASIKVPAANWDCVEAGDPLHTLRATSPIICDGNVWYAEFKGSPSLAENEFAHFLIGGNLNGDARIDIADFSAYISAAANVGTYDSNSDTLPDGSSDCGPGIHADVNGDGIVNILDFSFIAINFFKNDKARCEDTVCSGGGAAAIAPAERPRDRISVEELIESGIEGAAQSDFNGDGWVDLTDMQLFLDGEDVAEDAPERNVLDSVPSRSNASAGAR